MTREDWANYPNPADEPDMDNARRCEWDGCPKLSTMTDDYCAPHQQRHDDEKDPHEPRDPDWQHDDRDLL